MKLKKVRAILRERPWLISAVDHLTGIHPAWVNRNGGNWQRHIEDWLCRNLSEIRFRHISELDHNEHAKTTTSRIRPDEKISYPKEDFWRSYNSFLRTAFTIYCNRTYGDSHREPYSLIWTLIEGEGGGSSSIGQVLYDLARDHFTPERVSNPHTFNAVVRTIQVGIVGRCSATIMDVYTFPVSSYDI